jgi:hypothetical protein
MGNTQLTITDMVSIKNIIDAACTRGAFKASEMKQVGELYEKLGLFIESVQAQAVEQSANTQGEANAQTCTITGTEYILAPTRLQGLTHV